MGGDVLELYFVATDKSKAEASALSVAKPNNILGSYFYFRNKSLKDYFGKIGYVPKNFMLDSGAFSAWTSGKNISLVDYINYINENKEYIQNYISLDVIGDADMTYDYYKIMKKKGLNPMPVFHYGADMKYLEMYAEETDYIALGATVPVKDKKIFARWINGLQYKFPHIKFHLLGSSSQEITMMTEIESCDSSSWIMEAINGRPKHIRGTSAEKKIERAIYNLRYLSERSKIEQLRMAL